VYYCWIQHSLMPNSTPPWPKKKDIKKLVWIVTSSLYL
jgi:hypothetical protein